MAGAIKHAGFGSLNHQRLCRDRGRTPEPYKASGCRGNRRGLVTPPAWDGKAFILAEEHRWLRLLALGKLRDPVQFWNKLEHLAPYTAKPPEDVRKLLESSLHIGAGGLSY